MPSLIPQPDGSVRWDYDEPPAKSATKPELQELARSLGLDDSGTKAELEKRIAKAQADNNPEES